MEYITTVYNPSLFAFLRNVVICFFVNGAVLLEGCFAGLAAGTWKEKDGEHTMVFHGNGTCADVPVKTLTGADPVSYVIEKDRTLVFTMKWDGKIAYEKAETKEEALQDPHLYYLQEDTFILKEKEYTRQ